MKTLDELKEEMRRLNNNDLAERRRQGTQLQNKLNATAAEKELGQLIVQAANEIAEARERTWEQQARAYRELAQIAEQREDERQAQILARAMQIRAAASDEQQQKIEQAKEAIKEVLAGGLEGYFDEFYNIVSDTAKTRGRGKRAAGKRAAAQMLLAAYSSGAVDRARVLCFADWLREWTLITGIAGNDDNYKECKISETGYYDQCARFSPKLRAILYPEYDE